VDDLLDLWMLWIIIFRFFLETQEPAGSSGVEAP
jgi:hypothetical protein